jgi:hypothetical protein
MLIRDGDWVLFDHDHQLKRTVWRRENPDGSSTFRTDYQVDDTIEANREARLSASSGFKGDWHRIASIPLNTFYDELAQASLQGDDKFMSRWLNDADHRAFRTKEGRV